MNVPGNIERVVVSKLHCGDYVLATKWGDGDPQDQWCVGFYERQLRDDRHLVCRSDGTPFRASGFRRVERISRGRGEWILSNMKSIEQGSRSLWGWKRAVMRPGVQ